MLINLDILKKLQEKPLDQLDTLTQDLSDPKATPEEIEEVLQILKNTPNDPNIKLIT